jgi:hypothetical protein
MHQVPNKISVCVFFVGLEVSLIKFYVGESDSEIIFWIMLILVILLKAVEFDENLQFCIS